MNLKDEGVSTEQFIKNLTSTPTLSELSDQIKGYQPPVQDGYEGQPLIQPMHLASPAPQPTAPDPLVSRPDPSIARNEDFLQQAAQTTRESARREQILKENYLKSEKFLK